MVLLTYVYSCVIICHQQNCLKYFFYSLYFSCAETSVVKEKQSESSVISGDQLTESSDAEVDNLYEQEVLDEMKEETEEMEETEETEEMEEMEETEETEKINETTNRFGICHQILV